MEPPKAYKPANPLSVEFTKPLGNPSRFSNLGRIINRSSLPSNTQSLISKSVQYRPKENQPLVPKAYVKPNVDSNLTKELSDEIYAIPEKELWPYESRHPRVKLRTQPKSFFSNVLGGLKSAISGAKKFLPGFNKRKPKYPNFSPSIDPHIWLMPEGFFSPPPVKYPASREPDLEDPESYLLWRL